MDIYSFVHGVPRPPKGALVHYPRRALKRMGVHKDLTGWDAQLVHIHASAHDPRMETFGSGDPVVKEFKAMVKTKRSERFLRWQKCKQLALSQMSSCTSYRTSQILYLCRKSGYFDEDLLDALLGRAMDDEQYMLSFGEIGTSMSIQSLGMLSRVARKLERWERRPIQQVTRQFAVEFISAHVKRNTIESRGFSSRNIACTLHGLGLLFMKESNEFINPHVSPAVQALLQAFLRKSGHVLPIEISTVLHGCANLGIKKGDGYLSEEDVCNMVKWGLNAEEAINGQALSMIVWSMAKMGYDDQDALDSLTEEITRDEVLQELSEQALANIIYSFGVLSYCNQNALHQLSVEIAKGHRIGMYKSQDLGSIVYGFGKLGYCPKAVFQIIGEELTKKHRLANFDPQAFANVMYGFGRANYFSESIFSAILNEVELRLSIFSMLELTGIIYGLGLVHRKISESSIGTPLLAFMEAVCSQCKLHLDEMKTRDIANVCKALCELRFVDKHVLDLLLRRYVDIVACDEGEMLDEQICMILGSCATLNHHNSSFLRFARNHLQPKVCLASDVRALSNLLWSYAVLEILEPKLFMEICEQIHILRSSGVDIDAITYRQLAQVWMYTSIVKKHKLDLTEDTRALVDKALDVWQSNHLIKTSRWETQIAEQVAETGLPCYPDAKVANGLMRVDIFVSDGPQGVVIECDGPSHFSSNKPGGSYSPLGHTLLRNKILEAHGYKVGVYPVARKPGGVHPFLSQQG